MNKKECNGFNQYYTDIIDEKGNLVTIKCFKGEIYKERFNVNDYKNYQSENYYSWVNKNFKDYAFPDEQYNSESYSENDAYISTCENKKYSLKQQQKFTGRIFNTSTEINSMLIYHGLGSGKTQTSIVIGEAFKFRKTNNLIIPGRTDARVLIVVPAALQKQYYAEIIGKYEDGVIKSAPSEIWISGDRQFYSDQLIRRQLLKNHNLITKLQSEIAKLADTTKISELTIQVNALVLQNQQIRSVEDENVNRIYEILSHETFLNKLFKIEDGKYIQQPYIERLKNPNSLLIIDEIQNLISGTGTNYRRLFYALRYYADPAFKTVFLTGTPIYDKPYEFGLLINLLRPRVVFPDGRDAFNEVFIKDSEFINKEYFKNICSGYISYFKGGNPIAYPYKKTTIMYHKMEEYQYNRYKEKLEKEVQRSQRLKLRDDEFFTHQNDENVNSGVFNVSNQFCNIAFPEAQLSYLDTHPSGRSLNSKSLLQKNVAHFKTVLNTEAQGLVGDERITKILTKTREYSTKFAKVAEMIHNCEGSVFVFSNFVYFGVEALSVIMETIGYKSFPKRGVNGSFFVWKGEANKFPEQVQAAKRAFNDPANIDGKLLKVMFGTQTVMEGVDFKNVNQIHILDPWWNDSRLQQVIARGIRLCSHKDLPANKRVVNVFIHLATMGSYEKVYNLKIIDSAGHPRNITSFMIPENPDQPDTGNWVFHEAYAKADQEQGVTIKESSKLFRGHEIVPGSVVRGADQELTKAFGNGWKGLDSRSVQEYMYTRSLEKLNIARQFDKVIKEVAIDCNINQHGNVVRLNEIYRPNAFIENVWELFYENYSTGETFIRLNTKQNFTLQEILRNESQQLKSFSFKNIITGNQITVNKSLIVSEKIDCKSTNYKFDFPSVIVDITLNKELIPFLLKLDKSKIINFFNDVQFNNAFRKSFIKDPKLHIKIKTFPTRKLSLERQKYIDALKDFGFNGDESLWDEYTLEQLKFNYEQIKKK